MDKQDDPLRKVIAEAMVQSALGETAIGVHLTEHIAAAVRVHLMGDEAIEAAAKAHCDHFGGEGWWETGLLKDTLPEGRKAMRGAIVAMLSETSLQKVQRTPIGPDA